MARLPEIPNLQKPLVCHIRRLSFLPATLALVCFDRLSGGFPSSLAADFGLILGLIFRNPAPIARIGRFLIGLRSRLGRPKFRGFFRGRTRCRGGASEAKYFSTVR